MIQKHAILIFMIYVTCLTAQVPIDDANFPDANFRIFLEQDTIDKDTNGILSVSEIDAVTDINISLRPIADLTGIKHFTALTKLVCAVVLNLKSIDLSENTNLQELYCYHNKLTSLNVSANTNLRILRCYNNNELTSLDLSNNTALTELYCYNTSKLTRLDVSNSPALITLDCRNSNLKSLNIKNGNNAVLTTFDATLNSSLVCIKADSNSAPQNTGSVTYNWKKDAVANYNTSCGISWTGTTNTDWATSTNWSGGSVPTSSHYDVTIPMTPNNPIISSNTNASVSSITINNDASLTINNGSLNIINNATGNITYNRNLPTTNWYFVSSPVTGQTYNDAYVAANSISHGVVNPNNRGIQIYEAGTGDESFMQAGTSADFIVGRGYSVKRKSAGNISFTGALNSGDVTIAVLSGRNGLNFLGNPYTSYINSGIFLTDNSANLITETIWIWNPTTKSYEAKIRKEYFKLRPTEGFFIEAKTDSDLTFAYTNKLTSVSTSKTIQEIKLKATDGTSNKLARILYFDDATKGLDIGGEGESFNTNDDFNFNIYTHLLENNVNKKYDVQSLPKSSLIKEVIPIGVKAKSGKEITFSIETSNLPSGVEINLEDNVANTNTRLDTGTEYKVTLTADIDSADRFYLHTTQDALSIENNEVLSENINVYKTNDSKLRITGLPVGKATIRLYSILGKQLANQSFYSNGVKDIPIPNLASGIYVIKIITARTEIAKKIFINP